jgi:hypothetical protein
MNILASKTRALALLAALGLAASANAAIVWDLNPSDQNGPTGQNTITFNSGGYNLTARGYDNFGGTGTPTELAFKNETEINGAVESGLGVANASQFELYAGQSGPADFIQLDLRTLISQGFGNFQIAVGSVQAGEGFQLFGSNSQGVLGTALSGPYEGLAFDDKFVPITGLGTFQFVSVVASNGNVLPTRFSADITPVPEMSALMPIVGLLVAVGATSALRRRRAAASE